MARVLDLLDDLVAFRDSVLPQPLYLLLERVAAADLLFGGEAGVEDGPLGAMAVGAWHRHLPPRSNPLAPRQGLV